MGDPKSPNRRGNEGKGFAVHNQIIMDSNFQSVLEVHSPKQGKDFAIQNQGNVFAVDNQIAVHNPKHT